ncbi:hypothetical protein BOTBODRAFT_60363 [Botryobasidium botryosum FD-172 SS1]|uniref:BTB domain-containing protein n=1 Tax=Botryobasidium botryosum (strain FD-172 SS1) TaxID=930990 RepID=A0A067LUX7_BOTB1|nr:hypothetical protein BOTBODRAFT_60363 [Botryobasidium botryosum FD-172 SS1]
MITAVALIEKSFTIKFTVDVPVEIAEDGGLTMASGLREASLDSTWPAKKICWQNNPTHHSIGISLSYALPIISEVFIIGSPRTTAARTYHRIVPRTSTIEIPWSGIAPLFGRNDFKLEVWISGCDSSKWDADKATNVRMPTTRGFAQFAMMQGVLEKPDDHDVAFHFPSGQRLYADRAILQRESPYFHTMFRSGFQESNERVAMALKTQPSNTLGGLDPDSDRESDMDEDENKDEGEGEGMENGSSRSDEDTLEPLPKKQRFSQVPAEEEPDMRVVSISDASYRTLRALLYYIYTEHIVFAPLSFPTPHRSDAIQAYLQLYPSHPVPVSCKSIYALAHKYEMPKLESVALEHFHACLTTSNVMAELLSPFCRVYEQPNFKAMMFAAVHWRELKGNKEWAEATEKAMASHDPHFVYVSAKILNWQF